MTNSIHTSDTLTTKLSIAGMTCAACERHIVRALEGLTGVTHVTVDLERNEAIVEHVMGVSDAHSLIAAVRDAGYQARVVDQGADPVRRAEPSNNASGCCGCCAAG